MTLYPTAIAELRGVLPKTGRSFVCLLQQYLGEFQYVLPTPDAIQYLPEATDWVFDRNTQLWYINLEKGTGHSLFLALLYKDPDLSESDKSRDWIEILPSAQMVSECADRWAEENRGLFLSSAGRQIFGAPQTAQERQIVRNLGLSVYSPLPSPRSGLQNPYRR